MIYKRDHFDPNKPFACTNFNFLRAVRYSNYNKYCIRVSILAPHSPERTRAATQGTMTRVVVLATKEKSTYPDYSAERAPRVLRRG